MKHQIELDLNRISHLVFNKERRERDISWYDYRAEKRILFGLIRVRKEMKEGFWETVYDYDNIYDQYRTADELEKSGYKIYPDLQEKLIVKNKCYVTVVSIDGTTFKQHFYEEDEAIEWINEVKERTGKKYLKIEVI